jgi:hypothetical protein
MGHPAFAVKWFGEAFRRKRANAVRPAPAVRASAGLRRKKQGNLTRRKNEDTEDHGGWLVARSAFSKKISVTLGVLALPPW